MDINVQTVTDIKPAKNLSEPPGPAVQRTSKIANFQRKVVSFQPLFFNPCCACARLALRAWPSLSLSSYAHGVKMQRVSTPSTSSSQDEDVLQRQSSAYTKAMDRPDFKLSTWLRGLGLSQYKRNFKDQEVTSWELIASLTDEELQELGIQNRTHRNKLLTDIEDWLDYANIPPPPPASPPPSPPHKPRRTPSRPASPTQMDRTPFSSPNNGRITSPSMKRSSLKKRASDAKHSRRDSDRSIRGPSMDEDISSMPFSPISLKAPSLEVGSPSPRNLDGQLRHFDSIDYVLAEENGILLNNGGSGKHLIHDRSSTYDNFLSVQRRLSRSVNVPILSALGKKSAAKDAMAAEDAVGDQTVLMNTEGSIWHAVVMADQDKVLKILARDPKALDEKGAVGENPLHLCLLLNTPNHLDLAVQILDQYPRYLRAKYEKEQYEGETYLHIAIVNDRKEMVEYLLDMDKQHPDMNPDEKKRESLLSMKASGLFFQRRTNKSGGATCYYGEYPLHFAVCKNNMQIVDLLIQRGADLYAADSNGNTVLHMCVLYKLKKMYEHLIDLEKGFMKLKDDERKKELRDKDKMKASLAALNEKQKKELMHQLEMRSVEFIYSKALEKPTADEIARIQNLDPQQRKLEVEEKKARLQKEEKEQLKKYKEAKLVPWLMKQKEARWLRSEWRELIKDPHEMKRFINEERKRLTQDGEAAMKQLWKKRRDEWIGTRRPNGPLTKEDRADLRKEEAEFQVDFLLSQRRLQTEAKETNEVLFNQEIRRKFYDDESKFLDNTPEKKNMDKLLLEAEIEWLVRWSFNQKRKKQLEDQERQIQDDLRDPVEYGPRPDKVDEELLKTLEEKWKDRWLLNKVRQEDPDIVNMAQEKGMEKVKRLKRIMTQDEQKDLRKHLREQRVRWITNRKGQFSFTQQITLMDMCPQADRLQFIEEGWQKLSKEEKKHFKEMRFNCRADFIINYENQKRVKLQYMKNKDKLSVLAMAAEEDDADMTNFVLEKQATTQWSYGPVTCKIFPLDELDTVDDEDEEEDNPAADSGGWRSLCCRKGEHKEARQSILEQAVQESRLEVLATPIFHGLLKQKWKRYAKKLFFKRCFISLTYILVLTFAQIFGFPDFEVYKRGGNAATQWIRYFTDSVVVGGLFYKFTNEFEEAWNSGLTNYLSYLENCLFALVFFLTYVSVALSLLGLSAKYFFMSVGVLVAWCYVFCLLLGFRITGPFVIMIYKMMKSDVVRFAVIYSVLLLGFSAAFIVLQDSGDLPVDEYVLAFCQMISTLFMVMLGDVGFQDFNEDIMPEYKWLSSLFLLLYVIVITIMLLNLLIAMMGNTYDEVNETSTKEWNLSFAQIVLSVEHEMDKKDLRTTNDYKYWTVIGGKRYLQLTETDPMYEEALRAKDEEPMTIDEDGDGTISNEEMSKYLAKMNNKVITAVQSMQPTQSPDGGVRDYDDDD
eukprot:g14134.t1